MNKSAIGRIVKLEQKNNSGNGIKKVLAAMDGLSKGLPSEPIQISQEQQQKNDAAFEQLSDKEVALLLDLTSSPKTNFNGVQS
jgi:hypothetical protein